MKKLLSLLSSTLIATSACVTTISCESPAQHNKQFHLNELALSLTDETVPLPDPSHGSQVEIENYLIPIIAEKINQQLKDITHLEIQKSYFSLSTSLKNTDDYTITKLIHVNVNANQGNPYLVGSITLNLNLSSIHGDYNIDNFTLDDNGLAVPNHDATNVPKARIEKLLLPSAEQQFQEKINTITGLDVTCGIDFQVNTNLKAFSNIAKPLAVEVTISSLVSSKIIAGSFTFKITLFPKNMSILRDLTEMTSLYDDYVFNTENLQSTSKAELEQSLFHHAKNIFDKEITDAFGIDVTEGTDYTLKSNAPVTGNYMSPHLITVTFQAIADTDKIKNAVQFIFNVKAATDDTQAAINEIVDIDYTFETKINTLLNTITNTINTDYLIKELSDTNREFFAKNKLNITGYYKADGKTALSQTDLNAYDIYDFKVAFNVNGSEYGGLATVHLTIVDINFYNNLAFKLISVGNIKVLMPWDNYQIQDVINKATDELPNALRQFGGNFYKFTDLFLSQITQTNQKYTNYHFKGVYQQVDPWFHWELTSLGHNCDWYFKVEYKIMSFTFTRDWYWYHPM